MSYGTFACTLEGFDDSFDTMKAIAEYFRDLAADDRYFGAEPPTLDAELLARIAEKEVHRRVSAEVNATGVHLRTAPPPALQAAPEMAPTADPVAAPLVADAPSAPAETPIESAETAPKIPRDTPAELAHDVAVPVLAAISAPVAARVSNAQSDYAMIAGIADALATQPAAPASDLAAPAALLGSEDAELALPALTELTQPVQVQPETVASEDTSQDDFDAYASAERPDDTTLVLQEPTSHAEDTAKDKDIVTDLPADAPIADTVDIAAALAPKSPRLVENVASKLARIRAAVARSIEPVENTYDDEAPIAEAAAFDTEMPFDEADKDTPEPTDTATKASAAFAAAPQDELRARVIKVKKNAISSALRRISGAPIAAVPAQLADADRITATDDLPVSTAPADTLPDTASLSDDIHDAARLSDDIHDAARLSDEAEADLMRDLAEVEAELAGIAPSVAMDHGAENNLDEDDFEDDYAELDDELDAELDDESDAELDDELSVELEDDDTEDNDALGRALNEHTEPEAVAQNIQSDADLYAALGHLDLDFPGLDQPPAAVVQSPVATAVSATSETDDQIEAVVANLAKTEAAAERRTAVLGATEHEEDRVSRLLDQTNSALERHENKRRRSAIAHLKAAVMATKAEEGDDATNHADPLEPYRADLASVVRPVAAKPKAVETPMVPAADPIAKGPVRPERPGGSALRRTERPAQPERAGTPLVLVSEQRVDATKTGDAQKPVLPRRVTKGHLADEVEDERAMVTSDEEAADIFANSTTFADFTENMGASGLHEMLECAAAYTSYVEGRPHFSHPDILRRVRQMDGQEELSREDSLRTFGQLLRQGKIRKVKRGQFTISKNSRYIQDARSVSS